MGLIDTYNISTLGVNSKSPFTIVSNGILLKIVISPPFFQSPGGNYFEGNKEKEKEKVRKITITACIEDKEYVEHIIVKGKPKLNVGDFDVEISFEDSKPQITVKFK
tara:strand:- start:2928 stop:3248 length:321 start_codon:yes stop_codon:yes gene_type:complete